MRVSLYSELLNAPASVSALFFLKQLEKNSHFTSEQIFLAQLFTDSMMEVQIGIFTRLLLAAISSLRYISVSEP